MRRKNVPQVMRTMRQQTLDRTSSGIGIIDAIALDDRPPSLVERRRVVGRIEAGGLDRLDEQGSGIFASAEQNTTMAVDVSVEVFVEIEQVGQDQPERLLSEEGGTRVFECDRWDKDLPPMVAIAPAQLAALQVFKPAF